MLPWGGGGGADRSVVGGRAAGDKPATVEDVMPIATGLEREELAAELKVEMPMPSFFFVFFLLLRVGVLLLFVCSGNGFRDLPICLWFRRGRSGSTWILP